MSTKWACYTGFFVNAETTTGSTQLIRDVKLLTLCDYDICSGWAITRVRGAMLQFFR